MPKRPCPKCKAAGHLRAVTSEWIWEYDCPACQHTWTETKEERASTSSYRTQRGAALPKDADT